MMTDSVRLLVSDNTQEFGRLIAECASRLGWECVLSPDLASFNASLQGQQFDLVCMQMLHPEVDGLGAMQVLGRVGFNGKVMMFNHSTELYSYVAGKLSDAHGISLTNYRWPLDPCLVELALVKAIGD